MRNRRADAGRSDRAYECGSARGGGGAECETGAEAGIGGGCETIGLGPDPEAPPALGPFPLALAIEAPAEASRLIVLGALARSTGITRARPGNPESPDPYQSSTAQS
jgi:hypothetical protein